MMDRDGKYKIEDLSANRPYLNGNMICRDTKYKLTTHLQMAPPKAMTITRKAAAQPITEDKVISALL